MIATRSGNVTGTRIGIVTGIRTVATATETGTAIVIATATGTGTVIATATALRGLLTLKLSTHGTI